MARKIAPNAGPPGACRYQNLVQRRREPSRKVDVNDVALALRADKALGSGRPRSFHTRDQVCDAGSKPWSRSHDGSPRRPFRAVRRTVAVSANPHDRVAVHTPDVRRRRSVIAALRLPLRTRAVLSTTCTARKCHLRSAWPGYANRWNGIDCSATCIDRMIAACGRPSRDHDAAAAVGQARLIPALTESGR